MVPIFFLLFFCVLKVHGMAITGPVLARYQPCGLGVVLFDKITDSLWRAEVNLKLYQHMKKVEIAIEFEKQMTFYGVSHNSTVVINNKSHNFTFIPNSVPDIYHVYVSVNGSTAAEIPLVKSFQLNNQVLCNELVKNADTIDSLDRTKPDSNVYGHVCGRRSLQHSEVNFMRTDAQPGDWPWHVAILIQHPFLTKANYQCGGNVISRTAILTAGHCMFLNGTLIETKRIFIEAGITNLQTLNHPGKKAIFAERIILHPDYKPEYSTSDLAIVVVNKLQYTEYVQPICIWGPVYDKTALFGQQAVTTGYGTTEQNVLSDTLRSTNTMIQNDTTCIAFDSIYSMLLNEFTFCAGFGPNSDINPRNGDSGGGLVVPMKQGDHKVSWFLRGVLSKCVHPTIQVLCDPKYYVVFTDVGPHYGWIYHNSGLQYSSNIV